MTDAYFLENSDPNNFTVTHIASSDRYIFHVVQTEGGHSLCLAPWNRQLRPEEHTEHIANDVRSFAESEARKLRLIN